MGRGSRDLQVRIRHRRRPARRDQAHADTSTGPQMRFATTLTYIGFASLLATSTANAQMKGPASTSADPRVGLSTGWLNAGEASRNMTLVGHANKPEGWY